MRFVRSTDSEFERSAAGLGVPLLASRKPSRRGPRRKCVPNPESPCGVTPPFHPETDTPPPHTQHPGKAGGFSTNPVKPGLWKVWASKSGRIWVCNWHNVHMLGSHSNSLTFNLHSGVVVVPVSHNQNLVVNMVHL